MAEQQQNGNVQVKILKNVGPYMQGQIVSVSKQIAEQLCSVSHTHDGQYIQEQRRAMLLSEAEELEEIEVDPSKMTRLQMIQAGKKNIVVSKAIKGHAMPGLKNLEDVANGTEDPKHKERVQAKSKEKAKQQKAAKARKAASEAKKEKEEQKEKSEEKTESEV